jgi:hypothetical protein
VLQKQMPAEGTHVTDRTVIAAYPVVKNYSTFACSVKLPPAAALQPNDLNCFGESAKITAALRRRPAR